MYKFDRIPLRNLYNRFISIYLGIYTQLFDRNQIYLSKKKKKEIVPSNIAISVCQNKGTFNFFWLLDFSMRPQMF